MIDLAENLIVGGVVYDNVDYVTFYNDLGEIKKYYQEDDNIKVPTSTVQTLIRNGKGYIDTGINAANSNLKIEVRYEFVTMPTDYFYIIRAYVNESTNATRILYNKNAAVYSCLNSIPNNSLQSTVTKYTNVVYTDILKSESNNKFSYTTNGSKSSILRTEGAPLEGKNLLLFSDSASDDVSIKIYYLKIYDNDTLVRDYIPYITEDNEYGLYDLVTQQFYGNNGDGEFSGEVNKNHSNEPDNEEDSDEIETFLPKGYFPLPSIKFTGEQAIDTGVICNQDTQVRAVFIVDEYKTMYIYGVTSADNTASITAYRSGDAGRWRFGDQHVALNTDADEKIVWCVNINKQRIQRGNVESTYQNKVNDFTTEGTLVFGAGRLADGSIEEATRFVGRIVLFELYDGEELIRSFVPCKNVDGACGFWDTVSEQFFTTVGDTPLQWSLI